MMPEPFIDESMWNAATDPDLPPNTIEFRHPDGTVAARITLNDDLTVATQDVLLSARPMVRIDVTKVQNQSDVLADLLGAAPDRCGWRAGMDADDYRDLAGWLVAQGVTPPAPTPDGRGSSETAQPCPFCKGDPEALADAHGEGWRAGREEGRRNAQTETDETTASTIASDRPESDYTRRLTAREKVALRTAIGHLSSACDRRFPCVTCEGMYREVERLLNEQAEQDLAMHLAYRAEVVAEVAVHLGSHEDWDEIAKWCGGRIETSQDPSGEYTSTLVLPNGETGSDWSWLVLNHAGEFHIRAEVAAPDVVLPPAGTGEGS